MVWEARVLPLPVGGPSEYARARKTWLGAIVTVQLLMLVVSLVEFVDVVGGVMLGVAVFFGYLGWLHNMNITYIVVWGMVCVVHFFYSSIGGTLRIILETLTFQFSKVITTIVICLSSLAGSWLAWSVYVDFENETPRSDLLGQFLIGLGALQSPDETALLLPGAAKDPDAMFAGLAARGMGAQMGAQAAQAAGAGERVVDSRAQQAPGSLGSLGSLFGFSPPDSGGDLRAMATPYGTLAARDAAQAGAGAHAQGQAGLAAAQAQGSAGLAGAQAQGQAGLAGAHAQGQAGLAGAQARGQAGLAGAQGWFAGVQQQIDSGDQLGAYRDPFGVAQPSNLAVSNLAVDPFLTHQR